MAFSDRICFICSQEFYNPSFVQTLESESKAEKIVTAKRNLCSLFKLSNFDDFNEFSNDEQSGFCPACCAKYGDFTFSGDNVEVRKEELRTEIYRILEENQSSDSDDGPIKRFIFQKWKSLGARKEVEIVTPAPKIIKIEPEEEDDDVQIIEDDESEASSSPQSESNDSSESTISEGANIEEFLNEPPEIILSGKVIIYNGSQMLASEHIGEMNVKISQVKIKVSTNEIWAQNLKKLDKDIKSTIPKVTIKLANVEKEISIITIKDGSKILSFRIKSDHISTLRDGFESISVAKYVQEASESPPFPDSLEINLGSGMTDQELEPIQSLLGAEFTFKKYREIGNKRCICRPSATISPTTRSDGLIGSINATGLSTSLLAASQCSPFLQIRCESIVFKNLSLEIRQNRPPNGPRPRHSAKREAEEKAKFLLIVCSIRETCLELKMHKNRFISKCAYILYENISKCNIYNDGKAISIRLETSEQCEILHGELLQAEAQVHHPANVFIDQEIAISCQPPVSEAQMIKLKNILGRRLSFEDPSDEFSRDSDDDPESEEVEQTPSPPEGVAMPLGEVIEEYGNREEDLNIFRESYQVIMPKGNGRNKPEVRNEIPLISFDSEQSKSDSEVEEISSSSSEDEEVNETEGVLEVESPRVVQPQTVVELMLADLFSDSVDSRKEIPATPVKEIPVNPRERESLGRGDRPTDRNVGRSRTKSGDGRDTSHTTSRRDRRNSSEDRNSRNHICSDRISTERDREKNKEKSGSGNAAQNKDSSLGDVSYYSSNARAPPEIAQSSTRRVSIASNETGIVERIAPQHHLHPLRQLTMEIDNPMVCSQKSKDPIRPQSDAEDLSTDSDSEDSGEEIPTTPVKEIPVNPPKEIPGRVEELPSTSSAICTQKEVVPPAVLKIGNLPAQKAISGDGKKSEPHLISRLIFKILFNNTLVYLRPFLMKITNEFLTFAAKGNQVLIPIESISFCKICGHNPEQLNMLEVLLRKEDFVRIVELVKKYHIFAPNLNSDKCVLHINITPVLNSVEMGLLKKWFGKRLQVQLPKEQIQSLPIKNPAIEAPKIPIASKNEATASKHGEMGIEVDKILPISSPTPEPSSNNTTNAPKSTQPTKEPNQTISKGVPPNNTASNKESQAVPIKSKPGISNKPVNQPTNRATLHDSSKSSSATSRKNPTRFSTVSERDSELEKSRKPPLPKPATIYILDKEYSRKSESTEGREKTAISSSNINKPSTTSRDHLLPERIIPNRPAKSTATSRGQSQRYRCGDEERSLRGRNLKLSSREDEINRRRRHSENYRERESSSKSRSTDRRGRSTDRNDGRSRTRSGDGRDTSQTTSSRYRRYSSEDTTSRRDRRYSSEGRNSRNHTRSERISNERDREKNKEKSGRGNTAQNKDPSLGDVSSSVRAPRETIEQSSNGKVRAASNETRVVERIAPSKHLHPLPLLSMEIENPMVCHQKSNETRPQPDEEGLCSDSEDSVEEIPTTPVKEIPVNPPEIPGRDKELPSTSSAICTQKEGDPTALKIGILPIQREISGEGNTDKSQPPQISRLIFKLVFNNTPVHIGIFRIKITNGSIIFSAKGNEISIPIESISYCKICGPIPEQLYVLELAPIDGDFAKIIDLVNVYCNSGPNLHPDKSLLRIICSPAINPNEIELLKNWFGKKLQVVVKYGEVPEKSLPVKNPTTPARRISLKIPPVESKKAEDRIKSITNVFSDPNEEDSEADASKNDATNSSKHGEISIEADKIHLSSGAESGLDSNKSPTTEPSSSTINPPINTSINIQPIKEPIQTISKGVPSTNTASNKESRTVSLKRKPENSNKPEIQPAKQAKVHNSSKSSSDTPRKSPIPSSNRSPIVYDRDSELEKSPSPPKVDKARKPTEEGGKTAKSSKFNVNKSCKGTRILFFRERIHSKIRSKSTAKTRERTERNEEHTWDTALNSWNNVMDRKRSSVNNQERESPSKSTDRRGQSNERDRSRSSKNNYGKAGHYTRSGIFIPFPRRKKKERDPEKSSNTHTSKDSSLGNVSASNVDRIIDSTSRVVRIASNETSNLLPSLTMEIENPLNKSRATRSSSKERSKSVEDGICSDSEDSGEEIPSKSYDFSGRDGASIEESPSTSGVQKKVAPPPPKIGIPLNRKKRIRPPRNRRPQNVEPQLISRLVWLLFDDTPVNIPGVCFLMKISSRSISFGAMGKEASIPIDSIFYCKIYSKMYSAFAPSPDQLNMIELLLKRRDFSRIKIEIEQNYNLPPILNSGESLLRIDLTQTAGINGNDIEVLRKFLGKRLQVVQQGHQNQPYYNEMSNPSFNFRPNPSNDQSNYPIFDGPGPSFVNAPQYDPYPGPIHQRPLLCTPHPNMLPNINYPGPGGPYWGGEMNMQAGQPPNTRPPFRPNGPRQFFKSPRSEQFRGTY